MHRIFSGDGWLVFPDILKSTRDHRPSQRLVQQPPVLIILCILLSHVPDLLSLTGGQALLNILSRRGDVGAEGLSPPAESPFGVGRAVLAQPSAQRNITD